MFRLLFIIIIVIISDVCFAQDISFPKKFGYYPYVSSLTQKKPLNFREFVIYEEPLLVAHFHAETDQMKIIVANLNRSIELILQENYLDAIDTLLITKRQAEFLYIPHYINLAKLYLAYAYHQIDDKFTSVYYLNRINYRNNLPYALLFAGDLYYLNGEVKKALNIFKHTIKQDDRQLDAYGRLIYIYENDRHNIKMVQKYETTYQRIQKEIEYDFSLPDDLDKEVQEMKKGN